MKVSVTKENIDDIRMLIPCDQAKYLKVGCTVWRICQEEGSICFMITFPDALRGAVSWGGCPSKWGDWDDETQELTLDYGGVVNTNGYYI
jgi:hypothetical protein